MRAGDVMVVSFDDFLTQELQAVGGPAAFSPELWQVRTMPTQCVSAKAEQSCP